MEIDYFYPHSSSITETALEIWQLPITETAVRIPAEPRKYGLSAILKKNCKTDLPKTVNFEDNEVRGR